MRTTAVLLMLLYAFSGAGQQNTPPAQSATAQQPGAPTTFTSNAELVLVPVIVRRDGQPVTGLTKDAFELTDQGKKRSISIFEEIKSTTEATPFATSSGMTFSNHLTGAEPARRVTIVLLDFLNTDVPDQLRARKAVIDYIGKSLQPSEPTALLVLNSRGLRQVHSFSTNTATLIAAIRQAEAGPRTANPPITSVDTGAGSPPAVNADAALLPETAGLQNLASAGDLAAISDAQFNSMKEYGVQLDTLRAMEIISHAYAGIPGRKTLMWVTAGYWLRFPSRPSGSDTALRNNLEIIWKMLNASNIAVYPLDITGLDTYKTLVRGPSGPTTQPNMGTGWQRGPMREFDNLLASAQDSAAKDTYYLYAEATGGRPCVNNNDLKDCLERAAHDSAQYYMLGFYVPMQDRKKGWHKLAVKLNGNYGDVRYRAGYLVDDRGDGRPVLATDPQSVLAAYASPVDYTGVPLDVTLSDTTPTAPRHRIRIDVKLPPNAFAVDRQKNNHIELDISARAYRDGKAAAQLSKSLGGDLRPESLAILESDGLVYNLDEIELDPGKYQLKVVVRDRLTGQMGSVSAPLEIK